MVDTCSRSNPSASQPRRRACAMDEQQEHGVWSAPVLLWWVNAEGFVPETRSAVYSVCGSIRKPVRLAARVSSVSKQANWLQRGSMSWTASALASCTASYARSPWRAVSCAAVMSSGSVSAMIVKRGSESGAPWKSSSNALTRMAAAASSSSPVRVLRQSAEGTSTRASAETTSVSSARIAWCPGSSA